jgi:hypothetical protein
MEQARRVAEHGHAHSAVSRAPGQQLRAEPAEAQHGRARPAVVKDVLHACQRPRHFGCQDPLSATRRETFVARWVSADTAARTRQQPRANSSTIMASGSTREQCCTRV